jgi:hypothetical protein
MSRIAREERILRRMYKPNGDITVLRRRFHKGMDRIDRQVKSDAHMPWFRSQFRKPAPFHNGRKPRG